MQFLNKFQDEVINRSKLSFNSGSLSQAVIDAFYAVPRHMFIKRYRLWGSDKWLEVTEQNLENHLSDIYADKLIALWGEQKDFNYQGDKAISTLSYPSYVPHMIDLLKLEKGQKVFELGAGSGWSAALMGHVVGPAGKVVSLEIIPELVRNARETISKLGFTQVEILEGDAADGYEKDSPYDRVVFTAGSYDLPTCFYSQLKEGGILLFVFKCKGIDDTLILFEKRGDHFESISSEVSFFVPLTGKHRIEGLDAKSLESLLSENGISPEPVEHKPFGWMGANEVNLLWCIAGLRSFLSVSEPRFHAIRSGRNKQMFAFLDKNTNSLALARYDEIVSYGSTGARECLMSTLHHWVDIGMPGLANLKVKAYPIEVEIKAGTNEWLTKFKESQFLWSWTG